MALEELMLVNPKGKYPRRKSLQIVFPKPVKHMKVNPSAIDRVKEAGKGLMGDVTFKEVAGGVGGVASTVLIPQYLKLKGWKDVVGSGAVAVGGGLLVRQSGNYLQSMTWEKSLMKYSDSDRMKSILTCSETWEAC